MSPETTFQTKKEKLTEILRSLRGIKSVLGCSLVSTDGLLIASSLSEEINANMFAAMSAAMHGSAKTATSELKQGMLKEIIVESKEGKLLVVSAGDKACLVILTKADVNLGLILLEREKIRHTLEAILSE